MNRKQFCGLATFLLTGGINAGCSAGLGGDDETPAISNAGAAGVTDLSRMTLQLAHPQSAFINVNTGFLLQWASPADAPRTVRARLYRFRERRGGEERTDEEQEIRIVANSDVSWTVFARALLAQGGVYFVDLYTDTDRVRRAYIVGGGRAEPLSQERGRGVEIQTGGSGSLRNLTLDWSGGDRNPVGIARSNRFVLSFPTETDAPPNFWVRLRRYKERRGTDEPSADEQDIEIRHDAGTGVWVVERRNNFLLDRGAVYILEVGGADEPRQRNYVFLTEG
ncbi:MAG: hypothetical protein H7Y38_02255 [Armatimonadetes bacterium]|nr:hypothetical protein [Armatimonadota bacterium]